MALRRRRVTSPAVAAAAATTAVHAELPPEQERRKRRRKGPVAVVAGILAALLISGFTVWNASMAAFSGYTDNLGNGWSAGAVSLSDNDTGTAMYTVTGRTPTSAPDVRCISVIYTGTVNADTAVRLYGDTLTVTTAALDLSQYLNLNIEIGTDNTTPAAFDCTHFASTGTVYAAGTVYDFEHNHSGYTNGIVTSWTPHVGEAMSFRFTTSVQSVQGANGASVTGVPFKWETQSF